MSETALPAIGHPDEHPIGLVVTDDLRRSRLTVFFRYLLVIPHRIVNNRSRSWPGSTACSPAGCTREWGTSAPGCCTTSSRPTVT